MKFTKKFMMLWNKKDKKGLKNGAIYALKLVFYTNLEELWKRDLIIYKKEWEYNRDKYLHLKQILSFEFVFRDPKKL